MSRPKLGQVCTVKAIALKTHEWSKDDLLTQFIRSPIEAKDGIYIGYRVVHNGRTKMIRETGEFGTILGEFRAFVHESSRVVWLLVFNERENPVYVFPEDVRIYETKRCN